MSGAVAQARWAVVFEVRPDPTRMEEYLGIATGLRPALESIPGFLENERFRSLGRPGLLLSLSLWASEEGIMRWRMLDRHRLAQQAGREGIFQDYRLRVGQCATGTATVLAATDGQARFLTLFEGRAVGDAMPPEAKGQHAGPVMHDVFEHLAASDRKLVLATWPDARSAAHYLASHGAGKAATAGLLVRVARDYGLCDRAEAPQYYPPS